MIEIPLTQGQVALVDDIDADLAELRWYASYRPSIKGYYAVGDTQINGRRLSVLMHRIVLARMIGRELLRNEHTDHINHNTLDNRRSELRLASPTENCLNSIHKVGKTGYRGVTKEGGVYKAQISHNMIKIGIGRYDTPLDAAIAYDKKATELKGEFAILNFPIDKPSR